GIRLNATRRIVATDDNGASAVSSSPIPLNVWTHVAVAKESNGYLRIVVDGVSAYYGSPHVTANFAASKVGGNSSPSWLAADVRIYTRPLSLLQIGDLKNGLLPPAFQPRR